jgi:hypothetical protein
MNFCLIVGSFYEIKDEDDSVPFSDFFFLMIREEINMNTNAKSVFGVYDTWEHAKSAIHELEQRGFSHRDISLLVHAENGTKDALAPEKHTQSPKGMTAGASTGAILGGGLGLLAGLGSLVVPGVGPMLAFGPILGALSGIGMGGAAGGVVGAFIGVGFPKHQADYLHEVVQNGGILVSVHVVDSELKKEVHEILSRTGASEIGTSEREAISSVDDISPTFATRAGSPKEDFISRKQF